MTWIQEKCKTLIAMLISGVLVYIEKGKQYIRIGISSVTPTGYRNKYKFDLNTNMYISLLYVMI